MANTLSMTAKRPAPSIETLSGKIAVLALGSASPIFFYLLPMIVGTFAAQLSLTGYRLGAIASADEVGYTIGSVSAFFWIRRMNWRMTGAFGLALMLVGNSLCIVAPTHYWILVIGRLMSGAGAGIVQSLVLSSISDLRHPEHLFGGALAAQVLSGSLGLLIVPRLQESFGHDAVFFAPIVLILAIVPALFYFPTLPDATARPLNDRPPAFRLSTGPLYCLIGFAIFHIALFATWSYCERIAHTAGIASARISTILGWTTLAGLAGALSASWLGDRRGRMGPLAIVVLAFCSVAALLSYKMSESRFILSMVVFQFFCMHFALPYLWGSVGHADGSGRYIVLTGLAAGIGGALGANLGALLLGSGDLQWWRLVSCGCCTLSFVAIWYGSSKPSTLTSSGTE